MARYFRDEEEKQKRVKQAWGHTQLKYVLYTSREKAEERALQEEREIRELLSPTDKPSKRR
jgi:hypothetical protein